jgi:hypothetical protein
MQMDQYPIGYPPTQSGVEIDILKYFFTPLQARIALCLTLRSIPVSPIRKRLKNKFKLLSGNRWDLLKMMTGAGAMSIREASRIEDCLEPEELLLIFIKQRPLFKWALFVLN